MTRRPAARSQAPGGTRLQPAEDGDDRLGLLFIEEVTRSRHGVKGEGAYGALQQPDLGRPYVTFVRRPAQDEADRAADVGEVGPQLFRLTRVSHRQAGLEGRVETAGGTGGVAEHHVVRDPGRIAGRREQHGPDLLPDELDAAEQLDPASEPECPLERGRDRGLRRPAFEGDESGHEIGATVREPEPLRAAQRVRNHERLADAEGIEHAGDPVGLRRERVVGAWRPRRRADAERLDDDGPVPGAVQERDELAKPELRPEQPGDEDDRRARSRSLDLQGLRRGEGNLEAVAVSSVGEQRDREEPDDSPFRVRARQEIDSRSPARFNRWWDSGGSEGSRSGPGERRRWRRGRKPVEKLVQDQLLVLQEALVAVDQQRNRLPAT